MGRQEPAAALVGGKIARYLRDNRDHSEQLVSTTAGDYDYAANCRHWPAVDGPYPVGTLDVEVTDPLRGSQYAPTPTPTRRLYARLWYPAAEVAGGTRRPYFTEVEASVLPATLMALAQQPADALRNGAALQTNSWTNAAPAAGRFPVLGFNHGYTSYPAQQTALFEHLAANGYVVIAVGHPYESGGIVYPNGDVVTISQQILLDLKSMAFDRRTMRAYIADTLEEQLEGLRELQRFYRGSSLGRLAAVWRDDVYFVLDQLEDGAVAGAAAVGAVMDHSCRGYLGMSYGGYLAGMLAQGDQRARAVVHLDGGLWTYELVDTDLRTPFLTLGSNTWAALRGAPDLSPAVAATVSKPMGPDTPSAQDLAYERLDQAGLRADGHRIVVPGIYHLGVSDLPELAGSPALRAALGTEETMLRFTAMQNSLVGGFLDRYLKEIDNGFPDAALNRWPDLFRQDLSWLRERARKSLGRAAR